MKQWHFLGAALCAGALLGSFTGCGEDKPQVDPSKTAGTGASSAKPTAQASGAPTATATAATSATATAAATDAPAASSSGAPAASGTASAGGATADYPMGDLKPIDKECKSPRVLLASGPAKLGLEFPWPLAKQVLLAHDQFKVTKGAPGAPWEIHLGTHELEKIGYALVAQCKDAETCNKLAAMYQSVMRSTKVQPYCDKMPGVSDEPKDSGFDWAPKKEDNLPKEGDLQSECARLDACTIKGDHTIKGDPYLECQKAPHKFKTACAHKPTCWEVLACLK